MKFSCGQDDGRSIAVNVASREALLADLDARLRAGSGFAVATLNLDHVVKLRRDPAFGSAYLGHTHVTADGNPIVWLVRLSGRDAGLVTGSDLVDPVASLAARLRMPMVLFGSSDSTLRAAGAELVRRHPGLDLAATMAPPMSFDPEGPEADAAIERIVASGARLCLVALGAPKQEIFAARLRDRHPGLGILSIGAGLDFIAGTQRRAPPVMRRFAAEWLWRLATDPRRLGRRYAACAATLPGLALEALRIRRQPAEKVGA